MKKQKNLVIFGDRKTAEVAYEYFSRDSQYKVVGFTVEKKYLKRDKFLGLPMVAFEELEKLYPPAENEIFAAVVFYNLNRLRERIYREIKEKGYQTASYISSKANIWPGTKIGEHCFILEHANIEPFVEIGNNVFIWSGSQISHHTKIADNCFLGPNSTVAGCSEIGRNCFLGLNSTVGNNIKIGGECWINPVASVTVNMPALHIAKYGLNNFERLDEERLFKKLKIVSDQFA